jgi:mono/diheme cytochrome c family protein
MNFNLITTLGLLLVLSACSSSVNSPDPTPPTPRDLLTSTERRTEGRALFLRHCALCHGERGDGNGVRRTLSKPPADLSDPLWQQQADAPGIYRVIRDGVPRSPMAAWRILSEEQTWALTAHILRLTEDES